MDHAKQNTGDHRDAPRSDELSEHELDLAVGGAKAAKSQPQQQTYLEIKMTDCMVSNYTIG